MFRFFFTSYFVTLVDNLNKRLEEYKRTIWVSHTMSLLIFKHADMGVAGNRAHDALMVDTVDPVTPGHWCDHATTE